MYVSFTDYLSPKVRKNAEPGRIARFACICQSFYVRLLFKNLTTLKREFDVRKRLKYRGRDRLSGGFPRPGSSPCRLIGFNPEAVGVNPEAVGVDPEAVGVNPEAMGVDPGAMGVDPGAVGVNPGAMGVKPKAMGVNPKPLESSSRNMGSYVELRLKK
jgi:hypothetical protein